MGFVVKNTTSFELLDLLCPHTCRGCGQLGAVLCECCKKNLISQMQLICPICKQMVAKPTKKVENMTNGQFSAKNSTNLDQNSLKCSKSSKNLAKTINFSQELRKNIQNIQSGSDFSHVRDQIELNHASVFQPCPDCEMPFWGLWSFGWREGVLEKLVEEYKYQSVRAMGKTLVDLYDIILPAELENIAVVPLPTIGRHVRERGFDHTLTIAKLLAKRRGWKCEQALSRAVDTVQVGAKMADRKTQASKAYAVNGEINPGCHYLLLDDVWTTGSTMLAAEKVLRSAGAERISGVVLAISKSKTI